MKNYKGKGLCPHGYYYKNGNKYECENCKVVESIIRDIGEMRFDVVFRSLSSKEMTCLNNPFQYIDDRGCFEEIPLDNISFQGLLNKIFTSVRMTLNNKTTDKGKLYSYSSSLIIPLFKYIGDVEPAILIKKLPINAVDILVDCHYYQWVKGYYSKDEDHSYLTDSELMIPLIDLATKQSLVGPISEYIKSSYQKNKFIPYEYYLNTLVDDMRNYEEMSLDLADLDSISNIRVQGYTLDISKFGRSDFTNYLKQCSNDAITIKRAATYENDYEIISSSCPVSLCPKNYVISGNITIYYIKVLVVCLLAVNNDVLSDVYNSIICTYVDKIKLEYLYEFQEILRMLEKHISLKFETELAILLRHFNMSQGSYNNIEWFEKYLNTCVNKGHKNEITDELINLLYKL